MDGEIGRDQQVLGGRDTRRPCFTVSFLDFPCSRG